MEQRFTSRKEIHQFDNWWIFHTPFRDKYFFRGGAPEKMILIYFAPRRETL